MKSLRKDITYPVTERPMTFRGGCFAAETVRRLYPYVGQVSLS